MNFSCQKFLFLKKTRPELDFCEIVQGDFQMVATESLISQSSEIILQKLTESFKTQVILRLELDVCGKRVWI